MITHQDLPRPQNPSRCVELADPRFGEINIFSAASKTAYRSFLVKDGTVVGIPGKPFTLRALFISHLGADALRQRMVRKSLPQTDIVVWALPSELSLEQIGATAAADPVVLAALNAIAERLVAEIDPAAELEEVRRGLAIPDAGPCMRRLDPYEDYVADHSKGFGQLARLGRTPDLTASEIAEGLNLAEVVLTELPDPLPTTMAVYDHSFESLSAEGRLRDRWRRKADATFLVRPEWRAHSELVEAVAVRHGIPAAREGDSRALRGTAFLDADEITPLPSLAAVSAPGLRLVAVVGDASEPITLASLAHGLFAPWDPVEEDTESGWMPHRRAELRAARAAVADAVGDVPTAILPAARSDLLGFLGTSRLALRYVLELGDEHSPLPWKRSKAATEEMWPGQTRWTLDLEQYRRELLTELAVHAHASPGDPVHAVSDRLVKLAQDIKALANPAFAEIEALGCPPDLIATIVRPLEAARNAMTAATPSRLASTMRTGKTALAAIVATALAYPPPGEPPVLPPPHPGADGAEEGSEGQGPGEEENADLATHSGHRHRETRRAMEDES